MKTKLLTILLVKCALAIAISAQTDQALYINDKIQIKVKSSVESTNNIGALSVKVFDKKTKKVFQTEVLKPTLVGKNTNPSKVQLKLELILNKQLNVKNEYEIRIYSSGYLWKTLKLEKLNADFSSKLPNCTNAIPMFLTGLVQSTDNPTEVAKEYWQPILSYLKAGTLKNKVTVEASYGAKKETIKLKDAKLLSNNLNLVALSGQAFICLTPQNKPSFEKFNISVVFKNPTFKIGKEFIGKNISWEGNTAIALPTGQPKSPEKRNVKKNLDVGVSFTSSVKKDQTTNLKSRNSQGILDIRFAPILNTIDYKGGPWIKKWTPIYLNANVATGKITGSTLSLNRVVIGTDYDLRFVPNLKNSNTNEPKDTRINVIDYYRLKFSANHASDRDFKQKEITGKVEFQPVWAFLNKPRNTSWNDEIDEITNTRIRKYKTFGWEIVPKFGFQFGKTYSRRNPTSAINETDLIKRLYGGIEMKLDITPHLSFKIENTLFGRYESKSNRLKNYFKGEVYAPIGNPLRQTTNGLFLTFEKGDAPPFTNTVNVVKFGYRIQSNGWNVFN